MPLVQDRQHTNKLKYSYYYLTLSLKQFSSYFPAINSSMPFQKNICTYDKLNLYAEPTKWVDELHSTI